MADELSNTDLARSASHRSNHQPSQQQQAPPAAYIPPHANSMSVADGMERNTLGARRARSSKIDPADKAPPELRISLGALPQTTEQITTQSVASGSSPSTSTPGSNTPGGSRTKMKPSRPTRDGLDLRLPAKPSSDGTSPQSFGVRSSSNSSNNSASPGFPWGSDDPGTLPPPPTTATNSRFSSSTSVGDYSSDGRYSLAPPPSIRPYSTASSAPGSHLSVASHMSYILNPPQVRIRPTHAFIQSDLSFVTTNRSLPRHPRVVLGSSGMPLREQFSLVVRPPAHLALSSRSTAIPFHPYRCTSQRPNETRCRQRLQMTLSLTRYLPSLVNSLTP